MRTMRCSLAVVWLVLAAASFSGCGLHGTLGAQNKLLLQGFDTTAHPGQPVHLAARLQGGDYLRGMEGYLIGFYQMDRRIGESRTDEKGLAEIPYTPTQPGVEVFLAKLEDPDARKKAVPAVEIVVAAWEPAKPLMVVDMDLTLVKSGFNEVLAGRAVPMPDSSRVLNRLGRDYGIVYLTHRPDYMNEMSKGWLRQYNYPVGPVLVSNMSEFFQGSRAYKSAALADLKKLYPNVRYGIGDRITDLQAYLANGLRSVLILHLETMNTPQVTWAWSKNLMRLPPEVEAVDSWTEVEQIFYENRHFTLAAAISRLDQLGRRLSDEAVSGAVPIRFENGLPVGPPETVPVQEKTQPGGQPLEGVRPAATPDATVVPVAPGASAAGGQK